MKVPNRKLGLVILAIYGGLCCSPRGQAQSTPALTIATPSNGMIISPGQRIKVVVEETGGATNSLMEGITIEGPFREPRMESSELRRETEGPFKGPPMQSGGPRLEFDLLVPERIDPGSYSITAIGVVIGGAGKYSQSIPVNLVIPGVLKVSRIIVRGYYPFTYVGQKFRLDTREHTDHGPREFETDALSFKSLDKSVASVDKNGIVTAQGTGSTKIVVSYEDATTEVPIIVKATGIKGDFLGHGQVDVHDIELLRMSLNRVSDGISDSRDLNHDGVIDEKDMQIEESLCTHSNCAPTIKR